MIRKDENLITVETNKSRDVIMTLLLGICLFLTAAGGPLLMHGFNQPLLFNQNHCPAETFEADVRISPGSYIHVVPDNLNRLTLFPKVRLNDYQQSLDTFLHPDDVSNLRLLNANTIVMNAYDLNRQDSFWLVMDSSLLPKTDGVYAVCGQWDSRMFSRGLHYYYVHKFKGKIDIHR